ncbi:MAG: HNH endonuclease family protein, partial [Pseudomonadota bacterium]
ADEGGPNGATWRISLNHIDGPYLREAIQSEGASLRFDVEPNDSESQRRMTRNLESYIKSVRAMSPEAQRELAETIKNRIVLVRVVVEDWDGGYNVFRVLNTRGKAPNTHDIIKTDLLENAHLTPQEADEFSREWSEHESRLSGSGFDDLLNQISTLYARKTKKGASEFRKAVINRSSGGTKEFLSRELPAYVDAYVTISTGRGEFGNLTPQVTECLNHLRLIDHQLWRAPALKFLVNSNGSPETAYRFFKGLERFAYASMMSITEQRSRQRRYQKIADNADNPRVLLSESGPLALSREERREISNRLRSRFGAFAQRRAIALRMNAEISGGAALGPDDGATVEHVLPKNIPEDSPWHHAWPNPAVHRDLVDTLGNFALLSQATNQKADNLSFEEKRGLYFANGDSEFALTLDIRDKVAWTPEVTRKRTEHLAVIMEQAWQLNRAMMQI